MSNFKMLFSGDVRKPTIKDIGGKKAVEFSLMRKNYTKQGDEATFSWIKVTLFDPKDWQIIQCQEGKFVAGSGEFSIRSYVDKEGVKKQSAEVRCNSFDIDAPMTVRVDETKAVDQHPKAQASRVPAPSNDNDGCPF